ncbi:hypothetical protein MFU01_81140 [Myxococcus fulvus]|uniref:Uncharacterized protein n=1 Tax=Myxococcus fulvus TaxID=33 RepID=A0A511TFX4_MYXFU|nr:hypothetical protein MFU01_81140 [Myxococcus fulvus]
MASRRANRRTRPHILEAAPPLLAHGISTPAQATSTLPAFNDRRATALRAASHAMRSARTDGKYQSARGSTLTPSFSQRFSASEG